jgi:hypothetical protein
MTTIIARPISTQNNSALKMNFSRRQTRLRKPTPGMIVFPTRNDVQFSRQHFLPVIPKRFAAEGYPGEQYPPGVSIIDAKTPDANCASGYPSPPPRLGMTKL